MSGNQINNKTTTKSMIDAALKELDAHKNKGVTLYAIKKFICRKYELEMTARRKQLIKKHMHELLEKGQLQNVTGKGLNGHLRFIKDKAVRRTRRTITRPVTPPRAVSSPKAQRNAQNDFVVKLTRAPKRQLFSSTTISEAINQEIEGTPRSSLNEKQKRQRRQPRKSQESEVY